MRALLDTNVLLRIADAGHPLHPVAGNAVRALADAGHTLTIVPQVLYEFWAVATRTAAANGLGLSLPEARTAIGQFRKNFQLRRDERAVFEIWLRLVAEHGVAGVNSHDARLAAAMERHGLDAVLTFNGKDFRRFPAVTVLDPAVVAGGGDRGGTADA